MMMMALADGEPKYKFREKSGPRNANESEIESREGRASPSTTPFPQRPRKTPSGNQDENLISRAAATSSTS